MSRAEFHSPRLRDNFLGNLVDDASSLAGCSDHILLGFVCDPYCHFEASSQLTRHSINILHSHNLNVSILTKGGSRATRDFALLTHLDRFAVTLTFLRESDSLIWEKYAATPFDRIMSLRLACERGIPTWVSLEPVIDPDQTLQLLRLTKDFVGCYYIGTLNHRKSPFDLYRFGLALADVLTGTGVHYCIKSSLMPYMPPGFPKAI